MSWRFTLTHTIGIKMKHLKFDNLLFVYSTLLQNTTSTDSQDHALIRLFSLYKDEIMQHELPLDLFEFHKMFRQNDIIGTDMDMIIWYMISSSTLITEIFDILSAGITDDEFDIISFSLIGNK